MNNSCYRYEDFFRPPNPFMGLCLFIISTVAHGGRNFIGATMKSICKICKSEFYIKPSWPSKGRGYYCSRACFYKSEAYLIQRRETLKSGAMHKLKCSGCGIEFDRLVSCTKKKCRPYCSAKCRSIYSLPKGSNHHNWRGGITSQSMIERNSLKYKEWRTDVFKRDDFTCRECGMRGGSLEAHHILPFCAYPELRYDLHNGITLCEACHYKKPNGRKAVNENSLFCHAADRYCPPAVDPVGNRNWKANVGKMWGVR